MSHVIQIRGRHYPAITAGEVKSARALGGPVKASVLKAVEVWVLQEIDRWDDRLRAHRINHTEVLKSVFGVALKHQIDSGIGAIWNILEEEENEARPRLRAYIGRCIMTEVLRQKMPTILSDHVGAVQSAQAKATDGLDFESVLAQFEWDSFIMEHGGQLSEEHRTMLYLRFIRGTSAEDISRGIGIPVRTVHRRIHDGLAAMAVLLRKYY